jgi:hypothetical protein
MDSRYRATNMPYMAMPNAAAKDNKNKTPDTADISIQGKRPRFGNVPQSDTTSDGAKRGAWRYEAAD